MRMRNWFSVAFGASVASNGFASMLAPTSYDMPNGGSGVFSYHDDSYNGSGDINVDYATLTGGHGQLTDSIIAGDNWQVTPAPYVGWSTNGVVNPRVLFHFAVPVRIDRVRIHFDDANGDGGVTPPVSVTVGGTVVPVDDPADRAPFWGDYSLSTVQGNAIELQFNQRTEWVMVSEVEFIGSIVPEPTCSFVMVGAVLNLLRRRR